MTKVQSLFFYIILFIFSAMIITKVGNLYKKENTQKRNIKIIILTIIGIGIPIIIASIRYYVGTDYESYIGIYNIRKDLLLSDLITTNWEFLFNVIIKISGLLNNYQYLFGIMSFLTVIILYATIYEYKTELSLGFMFFLYLFLYFTTSFNIIRQALAIIIVAYSYRFIFERDLKKFIMTVLIASFFHITALVFLPFYLILDKNNTRKKIAKTLCLVIVLVFTLNYNVVINFLSNITIFERFELYSVIQESNNLEFLLNLVILSLVLLFRKPLMKYNSKNELFIYLYTIDVILMFSGYFSPFLKRIAMYFGISNIFVLASFPQIAKNNRQKVLIYFLLIIYAISIFIITTYLLKQGNIIPYNTIFER